MTKARRTRNNTRSNNRIPQSVTIVDEYSGQDGAKMDRRIAHIQNSHSQIEILVQGDLLISPAASPGSFTATFPSIYATDEFTSISAQFNEFQIKQIRYDVYDIVPASPVITAFGTFHYVQNVTNPVQTFETIIDKPDSQFIPVGTGKVSFTWTARGIPELQWQSTINAPSDYGGLALANLAGTGVTNKYLVVFKALVAFRGRN
jgi:hypothetical protein